MRSVRLALVVVLAALGIVLGASTAFAEARAITGTFSFPDQFTVQPGDAASCSFPTSFDLQVHGSFQVLLDASGEPTQDDRPLELVRDR